MDLTWLRQLFTQGLSNAARDSPARGFARFNWNSNSKVVMAVLGLFHDLFHDSCTQVGFFWSILCLIFSVKTAIFNHGTPAVLKHITIIDQCCPHHITNESFFNHWSSLAIITASHYHHWRSSTGSSSTTMNSSPWTLAGEPCNPPWAPSYAPTHGCLPTKSQVITACFLTFISFTVGRGGDVD